MNELISYPIPYWISIAFLFVIPIPVLLIFNLLKSTVSRYGNFPASLVVGLFFAFYIGYVVILGHVGAYRVVGFPPGVILYTTFPFLLFLFVYWFRSDYFKQFLKKVALHKLVSIHLFRLIGCFFILLAIHDALPLWFGLAAGAGDMFVAITSIFIAKRIQKKSGGYKRIATIWNTIGLVDILFTAISANILTKLSIDNGIMGVDTLAFFPFYLIPALAPPIIIALHYTIYSKLRQPD